MKRTAVLVMVLIVAAAFSAFGAGTQDGKKVTLSALYGSSDWGPDLNDKLIAEFKAKNPNVDINYIPIAPGDFTALIQAKIAANQLPDVVTINPDTFGAKLATEGWLADLKDTKTAKDEIDGVKGAFTAPNGVLFGVPIGYATCFMYYNKALFAKAGVTAADMPKDWDAFIALCRKLKGAGIAPIAMSTNMVGNTIFSFAFAQNVIPADKDWRKKITGGTFNFETPEAKDIFAKWVQLKEYYQEGAISTDYNTMNQLFVQGKAAMVFMGSWGATQLTDSKTNGFETGSFLVPFNKAGQPTAVAVTPETGWGVNAKSANIPLAKKFLDWLLFDKYAEIQKARGSIPHLKSLKDVQLSQAILDVLPQIQASKISGELYFAYLPTTLNEDAIAKVWQEIVLGTKNADQAAKTFQDLYKQGFQK
jgi:multiple sugar transport system substrate-binding protein